MDKITQLFVPFELAVMAKEKGFDEKCMTSFTGGKQLIALHNSNDDEPLTIDNFYIRNSNTFNGYVAAPAYQQLTDWFREVHNIHIETLRQSIDNTYCIKIKDERTMKEVFNFHIQYKTYYEALTRAIEEAFKLI